MTIRSGDTPLPCREAELSLGALVLGALDPAERLDVEAHTAICPRCRDILAELAPLPGLLNRLEPEQAEAGLPRPPDRLLDQAMRRAAGGDAPSGADHSHGSIASRASGASLDESHRRRRRWLALGVAAATVALVSLAALTTRGGDVAPPQAGPGGTVTRTAAGPLDDTVLWDGSSSDGAMRASVVLRPQTAGSQLAMTLSGVRSGQRCDLVIESTDGQREVTASWQATYEGAATVTASTSARPQQISRMLVTTPDGDTLLRLWPAGG